MNAETLTQEFKDLSITPKEGLNQRSNKENDKRSNKRPLKYIILRPCDTSVPSGPAVYPALPTHFDRHERFYALGWKVTDKFLTRFGKTTHPKYERALLWHDSVDIGIKQLKALSGWKDLAYFTVMPDDVPLPAPDDCPFETIIAIGFTATWYLYHNRPTQIQYDWLKSVFGREPQWWRDSLPKDMFASHGVNT